MPTIQHLTELQFLEIGLDIGGPRNWRHLDHNANIGRFKSAYGATPLTCHQMWSDLIDLGEIDGSSNRPKYFLLTLKFLFTNVPQQDLMQFFGIRSENTVTKWRAMFTAKIQKLQPRKMLTFEQADDGLVFFMTVDGTHCPIREPRPFSTIWSSHKQGGKAGLNYEVGLSIHKEKLVWVHGPTPPGLHNDLDVAREALIPALRAFNKDHPQPINRRILADGIYAAKSVADIISTKNEFDPREIEEFKDRATARQEYFNNNLKKWKVLSTEFRHDRKGDFLLYHRECFHCVAAICCYQIDNGSYSLFDPYPKSD
jgi:hypothetical protein